MKRSVRIAAMIGVGSACAWLAACSAPTSGGGHAGPGIANSYVVSKERVRVRLIRYDELDANRPGYWKQYDVTFPPQGSLQFARQPGAGGNRSLFAGLAADAAGALVGAAVDMVKTAIEKEAEKHEMSFVGSVYDTQFWDSGGLQRYAGFEVTREAGVFSGVDAEGKDRTAYRLICAFHASPNDGRIFTIHPVYFVTRAAKAKVSRGQGGGQTITSKTNIVMEGATISDKGQFVQQNLSNATFELAGYDIGQPTELFATFKNGAWVNGQDGCQQEPAEGLGSEVFGYFFAPSLSADRLADANEAWDRAIDAISDFKEKNPNKAVPDDLTAQQAAAENAWKRATAGGAFRLTTAVTESDESKVKKLLVDVAEFVGSQKESLVKSAKERVPSK